MPQNWDKHEDVPKKSIQKNHPQTGFIILLIILVLITSALLAWKAHDVFVDGKFEKHSGFKNPLGKRPNGSDRPPPLTNPDSIGAWMTFRYIGFAFGIPDSYLRESLKIDSKRFPNITIAKYAKENKLETNAFLLVVRNAVRQYLWENATKPQIQTGTIDVPLPRDIQNLSGTGNSHSGQ